MATVKGWPAPVVYEDEGISGTIVHDGRPGLQRLLAETYAVSIRAVIVDELSRFGRKTRLVLDLVEFLVGQSASLVSCKEALDTTTPQGKFALTLFAAIAQLEHDQTVDRTIAAAPSLLTCPAGERAQASMRRRGKLR